MTLPIPKFLRDATVQTRPTHPPPNPNRALAVQTEPIITELTDRETQTITSAPTRLSDRGSQTMLSGGPQIVEAVVHPSPNGVTTAIQTPDFIFDDNNDDARALSSDDEPMFDLGVGTTTRRRIKRRLPPADNRSNAIEYIDTGLKAIEYKPDNNNKVKQSKVKKPKSKLPPLQAPKSKVPKQQQQQLISSLQFVMPQLPPDPRPREYVSPNLTRMHHSIIREELLHHPRVKAAADKLKMKYGMSPSTSALHDRIMKQELQALDMGNPNNRIVPKRPPKPTPRELEKRAFEEDGVTIELSKEDTRRKPKMKKKEIVPKRPPKPTPRELEKRPFEEDKVTVELSKDTRRKPKARILAKDDDDLW